MGGRHLHLGREDKKKGAEKNGRETKNRLWASYVGCLYALPQGVDLFACACVNIFSYKIKILVKRQYL